MVSIIPTRALTERTGPWWVFLITGAAWILLSLAVLQFGLVSVVAISVLFGAVLLAAGLNELLVAALDRHVRALHVVLGILLLAGAVIAWVWPGPTFLTLARLVGWYLIIKGASDIVLALTTRGEVDLWWLGLIAGVVQVGLAFWVVGDTNRSAALLVLWVGLTALMRGITEIVLAFGVRAVLTGAAGDTPVSPADAELRDRNSWPGNDSAAGPVAGATDSGPRHRSGNIGQR